MTKDNFIQFRRMSRIEQEICWDKCINMILSETRWVLDNLEKIPEFQVNWERYGRNTKRYEDLGNGYRDYL